MKKTLKIFVLVLIAVLAAALTLSMFACADKENDTEEATTLRFTAPEGTPALAILRLPEDNKTLVGRNMTYEIVAPSNIAAEMSAKKSDLVIMPVNAGATLIKQGADYKLVSIAVDGSLYMVGRKEQAGEINIDDILGKKIACIGKTGVPGLVFRYVMAKNNVTVKEEGEVNAANREVLVQYVADGTQARTLLLNSEAGVDFAVVGEPAATNFLNAAPLKLNAKMNMQDAYKAACNNAADTYPQAGLFVKSSLASDANFMTALYSALKASKDWITANPDEVDAFAKAHLYESAAFPKASLTNCAVNAEKIDETGKTEVITFLKNVAPKSANGDVNDWENLKDKLFIK